MPVERERPGDSSVVHAYETMADDELVVWLTLSCVFFRERMNVADDEEHKEPEDVGCDDKCQCFLLEVIISGEAEPGVEDACLGVETLRLSHVGLSPIIQIFNNYLKIFNKLI